MNTSKTSNGKVALVTGASRGIGAAIAERLGREGYAVVVNYSGSAAAAEAVVRKIEQAGGRGFVAQADVSDPKAVAHMFDAAEAAFGGVDVLINNAGIMKLGAIAQNDDALFDQQISVNLKGTFNGDVGSEGCCKKPPIRSMLTRRTWRGPPKGDPVCRS